MLMKIVIFGVGVMGLLFGGLLVEVDKYVMLFDINDVYLYVIVVYGLWLEIDCGDCYVWNL